MKDTYSVLIVDDDFFSLEGIKSGVHFQDIGFDHVYYATGMTAACGILEQHDVDMMVTDIEMPGGSGLELQRWALEHGKNVVTMLLTCHASFAYAQDAIRLHIFDYILKPLRYADFEQKLLCAQRECQRLQGRERDAETFVNVQETSDAPLVVQIKTYIDDHISEELTRKEIGAAFYLSPDYVARIFKNEEGVSLTTYIRNRRIRIAQRLLTETNRTIEDISQSVGYSYNTYFFNTFKTITGVSPYQCRKNKSD